MPANRIFIFSLFTAALGTSKWLVSYRSMSLGSSFVKSNAFPTLSSTHQQPVVEVTGLYCFKTSRLLVGSTDPLFYDAEPLTSYHLEGHL